MWDSHSWLPSASFGKTLTDSQEWLSHKMP